MIITETLEPVARLRRDLRRGQISLSPAEARFMVDYYYLLQEERIRAAAQIRSMRTEPHEILDWTLANYHTLELDTKRVLAAWSQQHPVGQWAESIVGIGPIISAGLLAHIDIEKAPTAGHIWNFAGLNPGIVWAKGEKRPWNASLKTLCWKIGESFVKVSNKPDAYYGQLYQQRKALENDRNDKGELADQAAKALAGKRYGDDTLAKKAYEAGKLPAAHIHARAKRWVVKLFLASWHEVAYYTKYGTLPPAPYAIAILNHGHRIFAPYPDIVPGLRHAQETAQMTVEGHLES